MSYNDRKKATRTAAAGGAVASALKPRIGLTSFKRIPSTKSVTSSKAPIGSASRQLVHRLSSRIAGLLPRSFKTGPVVVTKAVGHYYIVEGNRKIYDASGGASVSIFGPGPHARVVAAARAQEDLVSYVCGYSLTTEIAQKYAAALIETTGGVMKDAVFYGSGSEAIEAMYKLTLQYFSLKEQPNRTKFIARHRSYHGTTWVALSMGGHKARRQPFLELLADTHHVAPCNPYRNMHEGETTEMYVLRLQEELREMFKELGPENVAAFVLEPVVGAALGCMPSLPGYLKAMQDVCREYGALFVVDEVMCGLGRTGKLHAWQDEDVTPDIQLMGKGLAGGYRELSAMLVGGANESLIDTFYAQRKSFNHGHTFQNSPSSCAAALEVLKIIQEQDLVKNVRHMGALLKERLATRLGDHPNVGDIRGDGFFIGLEFVKDRATKESFKATDEVAESIHQLGLTAEHNIHVYPGTGCNDGSSGDHFIVSPAYDITEAEVDLIVDRCDHLVRSFFAKSQPNVESL